MSRAANPGGRRIPIISWTSDARLDSSGERRDRRECLLRRGSVAPLMLPRATLGVTSKRDSSLRFARAYTARKAKAHETPLGMTWPTSSQGCSPGTARRASTKAKARKGEHRSTVRTARRCMSELRGARPGKPGRQTAGASSRTPQEAPVCARRMAYITPSKFAGHSMLCPYEGKTTERRSHLGKSKGRSCSAQARVPAPRDSGIIRLP